MFLKKKQKNISAQKLLSEANKKDIHLFLYPCVYCKLQDTCGEYDKLFSASVPYFKKIFEIKRDPNVYLVVQHECKKFQPKKEYLQLLKDNLKIEQIKKQLLEEKKVLVIKNGTKKIIKGKNK